MDCRVAILSMLRTSTTCFRVVTVKMQNFRDRKDPKRLQIKALDGTEAYLGSRSPQLSEAYELQSTPDRRDETDSQRPDTPDADQDSGFSTPSATSPPSPTTPEKACGSRKSPTEHYPSAEHNIAFADLGADLRVKAQMIGDIKTRAVAWHFFHYIESWFSGPTNGSNAEPNPDDYVPSTSSLDQRLRELKVGIITQEKTQKSVKSMKIVARVFRRVYVAELRHRYKEETAARKAERKMGRKDNLPVLSVKNRYTNLLFPETIKTCGVKKQSKKKGKKKEIDPRKQAKGKLEYWLKLGRLLDKLAQRYGIGIILLLPNKLTEKNIHKFPRHQIKPFLDYIDFLHPGLREDLSDLSALLTSIVENGLPSKRIVLETYASDQLSHLLAYGDEDATKLLVRSGIHPWIAVHSVPPVVHASHAGHESIVRYLLNDALNIWQRDAPQRCMTFEESNRVTIKWDEAERQWTLHEALSCAAERGHLAVVELLCQYVDVSKPCMTGTPFTTSASIGGSIEVLQLLLRLGVGLDPSALYTAADWGHLALVLDILSRRLMDVFYRDSKGRAPLHYAVKKGHTDIVQTLLDHGADHEVEDEDEYTDDELYTSDEEDEN
ncbi:hypothetical protein VE02_02940 [Pseudogymnoascus sp. 03VT05]|nr:hypothetical protein VE02_02940 [Pseudogymnoascus sp. 03VT05]